LRELTRSRLPRFAGVTLVLVGLFGVALAIYALEFRRSTPDFYERTQPAFWILEIGLCVLAIFVGVRCVSYRLDARKLASFYGLLRVITAAGWLVVVLVWFPTRITSPETFWVFAGVAACVLVFAVMSRRSAKTACDS
jgi:hypothetical protein